MREKPLRFRRLVAQVGNLLYRRLAVGWRGRFARSADCQSAIRQVANLRYAGVVALWVAGTVSGGAAQQTQARLVLANEAATPASTVMAGVHLHMNKGWHTYWRNSGDSGQSTTIEWQLPQGVSAGAILWPVPEKLNSADLITYVYHDDAVLLVPLTLANNLPEGPLQIRAKVSWLECYSNCVPGQQLVGTTLMISKTNKISANAKLIEEARNRIPREGSVLQPRARWEDPPKGDSRGVAIEGVSTNGVAVTDFFPYESTSYLITGKTRAFSSNGKFSIHKTVSKLEGNWPSQVAGVVVGTSKEKARVGFEVQAPFDGSGQPFNAAGLLAMLGLAFLGGLILNFMPCVLPVIALKILSFVSQSNERPARVQTLGIIYGVGVLVSFFILAGLAIAVQQAGGTASWGMALQNQVVRVVLTVLITLVALNLFGLFEVTFGGRAISAAGEVASKDGISGAFFNGVLATILATPCTAPFLTVALAFAFTQPPAVTALMFAATGIGFAAPFVLLSCNPAWLKVLPKPGVWMEKFKIAMGFPMLATAIWLFWFTAPRYGTSGVLWLGLFLVVLAASAWTFGEFFQKIRTKGRWIAVAVCLLLLAGGYFGILEGELAWRSKVTRVDGNSLKESPDGIDWQRWSPEAVAKARAEGHPVLVDFTAQNCLTCQVNKRTSLEIASTRAKLKETGTVAFLADFTDQDPLIAAELRKYGSAGVPLVLVFPKEPEAPAIILDTILIPSKVHEALEKASKPVLNLGLAAPSN